jgi:hypothetical protein
VAIDHDRDVSLLEMNRGPLPYVCPIAPAGHRPARLISAGYDEMHWPATVKAAHSVGGDARHTYTRERPWHGRSGGGLIDAESGYLVGVVSGYTGPPAHVEVYPGQVGIYVSHESVLAFIGRLPGQGAAPVPARPQAPPPGRPWISEQSIPGGQCPPGQ